MRVCGLCIQVRFLNACVRDGSGMFGECDQTSDAHDLRTFTAPFQPQADAIGEQQLKRMQLGSSS